MIEQILEADRYLQVDQVIRARDIYERVVELDPHNAIAVVGLARCALADSDDQEAHRLAGRALEIDPENDMARRMEARLSEILATRGEAVERPQAAAGPGPREMRPVVTSDAPDASPSPRPPATTTPRTSPTTTATPRTSPTTTATPSPRRPSPTRPISITKEPTVRKSLFDRLLGR